MTGKTASTVKRADQTQRFAVLETKGDQLDYLGALTRAAHAVGRKLRLELV